MGGVLGQRLGRLVLQLRLPIGAGGARTTKVQAGRLVVQAGTGQHRSHWRKGIRRCDDAHSHEVPEEGPRRLHFLRLALGKAVRYALSHLLFVSWRDSRRPTRFVFYFFLDAWMAERASRVAALLFVANWICCVDAFAANLARPMTGRLRAAGLCVRLHQKPSASPPLMVPVCVYEEHVVKTSKPGPPAQDITVEDLTPTINALVESSGVQEGTVTVVSRHTTTAVTINEWESRLVEDIRSWLLRLAPPDDRSVVSMPGGGVLYFHNDIDKRPDSEDERQRCKENGWDIDKMDGPKGLAAWRAQEPINAHSHLLSMILGSSEAIPVHKGKIVLGQWQSVMLVRCGHTRERESEQGVGWEETRQRRERRDWSRRLR